MSDLRSWDVLLAELQLARAERMAAVTLLQKRRRQQLLERRWREWRKRELRKRSSLVWKKAQRFTELEAYKAHCIEQALTILRAHDGIRCLFTTPKLLEAL